MSDSQKISFRCSECGEPICAPLNRGGTRGKCPNCGKKVAIPDLGTIPPTNLQTPAVDDVVTGPRSEPRDPAPARTGRGAGNPLHTIRDFKGETDRHRRVAKWVHDELAELDAYMREFDPDADWAGTDAFFRRAVGENRQVALDRMVAQVELAQKEFGNDHAVSRAAARVVLDACRRGNLPVPTQLENESANSPETATTASMALIDPTISAAIESLSKQLTACKRLVEYLDSCGEFTFEKHQEAYRIGAKQVSQDDIKLMWDLTRDISPPFPGDKDERPPDAWGAEYSRWVLRSTAIKSIIVFEATIPKLKRARSPAEAITILENTGSDFSRGSSQSSERAPLSTMSSERKPLESHTQSTSCTRCGRSILLTTAKRTGGLCMPCFKSPKGCLTVILLLVAFLLAWVSGFS